MIQEGRVDILYDANYVFKRHKHSAEAPVFSELVDK
jgi:hypothetical protein